MTVRIAASLATVLVAAAGFSAGPTASQPPLVSFRQSGGFVALERSFVVRRSGDVVTDGAVAARLAPKRLAALRQTLAAARWRTLAAHYAPRVHIPDGYVYTITYAGRPIVIDQGARPPERLRDVVVLLQALAPR